LTRNGSMLDDETMIGVKLADDDASLSASTPSSSVAAPSTPFAATPGGTRRYRDVELPRRQADICTKIRELFNW
jgi:hypothetical protein